MNLENVLNTVLGVGLALSAEKDFNKLFNLIIDKSMEITACDAGTLYVVGDDVLEFRIMKTISQGTDKGSDGEKIDIPPVPIKEGNICAYAAIHKKSLNIPDVYTSDLFDFSGPKKYDALTGYHTGSMIAVPLVDNNDKTVGVLQLINALDQDGNIIPFDPSLERTVLSLASQTAVAVTNMRYQEELKDQMWSFTEAMAAAIDERTPYNASHTRKVAEYCGMIADYINELHLKGETDEYFNTNRREQLVMGALLHDIGKLVIPLSVMNKATRLDGHEQELQNRMETNRLKSKVRFLEGKITEEEYKATIERIDKAEKIAMEANGLGFIPPDIEKKLKEALTYTIVTDEGEEFLFTDMEKKCLSIIKGTLTPEERSIMESHVVITKKILDKVHFNSYFKDSPRWATMHHELLNGRGYPNHLTADELPLDARITTVADICDALLATDRPYKRPIPREKAFAIMYDMADKGDIEKRLVDYLKVCLERNS
ncbi:MAG: HD domain-containing protein [Lachnospiraceae bacterium]|nr:HD domain-containing protein [Lachnospiraceae bacterium]